ncbi:MAG TPA: TonB-dependent receptor [Terracidiphilus sp.]|nr:TonB-dependent receptor [Terracidiphilus sp.]
MFKKSCFVATVLFACFFLGSVKLNGQELAGTINGTVTDSSGAVIPGATVTISEEGVNGTQRVVVTDLHGSYTVTNLPAGSYTISVSAKGFQGNKTQNVTLYVAQMRTVNVQLKLGQVSQTVTVQGYAETVNTTSSSVQGTITGTQVRELQLNNRNFEQLVTLQPGVVSGLPDEVGFGLSNSSTVAVNGARATANNWTVDGADINDSGSNATLLNVPSVDAIQEFTLERSTYDAEYGRSGGGQILTATKSGTSSFHGDAYEFDRNNVFNANSFFNKQATPVLPRAIERYNDFGFTIGGPLYIPKVYNTNKNKTFFFWSEEWRKVSAPVTSQFIVPTPAQLSGTFAGNISSTVSAPPGCITYDANTDTSTISPTCFSSNSQVYINNLYSKFPANTPGSLYTASYSQLNNTREDLVRFDANLTDKLHFFARAMQDETPENFPLGLFEGANFPGVAGSAVNAPGQNVVANLTWTISPRMVNEAEFAYTQGSISSAFTPGSIATSSTVSSQLTNNTVYTDPYGRIPGISFLNAGGITGYGYGSTPYFERNLDRNLFDNFSVVLGRHTLRAGATISQMLKTENASSGEATFEFNTFPDFLLGNVFTYTQASRDTVPDLHYYNFEAYVQDDWKVNDRLTLNLGLRYSYFPSPADVLLTLNNFDPLLFNAANEPAIDPATGNFAANGPIPATYVNGLIFPQGSACTQAQSIAPAVTCSPYGSHVNPDPKDNLAPRFGFAYDVFGDHTTSLRGGYGIFYDRMLNGIWEQNAFQDPPLVQVATINNTQFDHPLAGTSSVSLSPSRITSTGDPSMPNPSYMDFNLTLERQLVPDVIFDMAYVGSLGRHLLGEREVNQPTLAAREADPSAYVTAVVPFMGYAAFEDRLPEYSSNYNSLQASLNARLHHGLTLGIAYTWGKTLTNQSNDRGTETYNTYDPNMDYGPAALNQPQTFVANYVYDLPFFTGQRGILGHVLGGWEASGITEFFSGQSGTVTQFSDNFDCQPAPSGSSLPCAAGTYPGGMDMDASDIAPRPDLVAPVHLPKTQSEWFSTSSYADAIGHFGSAGSGTFLGPGLELWDLSAIKNVKFSERFRFQLRGEFYNAFNHTSFSSVQSATDASNFGQVNGTHDPREIQLGGKLYF